MDTSETYNVYIKMCDCKEIQEQVKWGDGNNYYSWEGRFVSPVQYFVKGVTKPDCIHVIAAKGEYFKDVEFGELVWLPRQDQLQEMVDGTSFEVLDEFIGWREFEALVKFVHNASMEQLWLAFVMEELYKKQWDGTEWQVI